MQYLSELLNEFHTKLDDIAVVDSLNDDLIKIYQTSLEEIKTEIENSGRFGGLLTKVVHKINNISNIEKLPEIKTKYAVLREQSIVLIIGSFEVFISDVFRIIAEKDPDYFSWKDKNEKISIDPGVFSAGFTLGDAMLSHLKNKKYSFQDLKSILRAIDNYIGVDLSFAETDSIRQRIVLGTSYRHIIVHNASKVDKQFMSQVRDLPGVDFVEGQKIELDQSDIEKVKQAVREFSEMLINLIIQREELPD